MSLFKARDWWSTWAGSDEEFDSGCLCVANIDNKSEASDKIIVGSYHGILRIFYPKPPKFKPEDLMLEVHLQQPILQIEVGRFVSGSDLLHLAILHPRKFVIYSISVISGAVEHGNHYTLNMIYEQILERTSYNMTLGPFGGVKGKDFICVQSMDGMLSFFEQESFAFGRFLPGFLLPGPLAYVAKSDCFITCSSAKQVESYRYQTLAVATDANNKEDLNSKNVSGKRLTVDWTLNIGENAIDIKVFSNSNTPVSILILGERSFFCLKEDGTILFMKKLEYNPSCFIPYDSVKEGTINTLIGTHNKTLMVYNDITLTWAAQLSTVPVTAKTATFQDLKGVIVTLDDTGYLECSYLGTDPSLFVTPAPDARDINYEKADSEMKELQAVIKESTVSPEIVPRAKQKEDLQIQVNVPSTLDKLSQSMGDDGDEDNFPSITVTITLRSHSPKPLENVVLSVVCNLPLACNRSSIPFAVIGDKSEAVSAEVTFYSRGGMIPSSLKAQVTASYCTSTEVPRVSQAEVEFPLALVCGSSPPVRAANYKVTIDTNKPPVNLAEIFPEMVNDAVIPIVALGIQYYGGPVVTILASKTSQRYRLQCDQFEGLWLILHELVRRLDAHFKKIKDNVQFRASFMGPLPLPEYYELIDIHFEQRRNRVRCCEFLSQRAQQFRAIQRRLLTRFKDKTPAPLANLDTLLDGTYRQLLALGEAEEDCERAIEEAANSLSCATRLINFLIKLWTNISDKEFEVLEATLSPNVSETEEQGWEEVTDAAISHLLRTCLAKNSKDQAVTVSTMKIPKDTSKLKKHIALLCDRLNKGGKLDLSLTSASQQTDSVAQQPQQQKTVMPLEPLKESHEEEDANDGAQESAARLPNGFPQVVGGTTGSFPHHKKGELPDLGKRLMVDPGTEQAADLRRAVNAALGPNGLASENGFPGS